MFIAYAFSCRLTGLGRLGGGARGAGRWLGGGGAGRRLDGGGGRRPRFSAEDAVYRIQQRIIPVAATSCERKESTAMGKVSRT